MKNEHLPKIAICGPGLCGKDTAVDWLAKHTILRPGRSTSEIIAPIIAKKLGLSVEVAFSRRREDRHHWYEAGRSLRSEDPAFLVREAMHGAQITSGLRVAEEVLASRAEGIVDVFIWINRDVPADPTMKFGSELCDITIENRGSLDRFYSRLSALARLARILQTSEGSDSPPQGGGSIPEPEAPHTEPP